MKVYFRVFIVSILVISLFAAGCGGGGGGTTTPGDSLSGSVILPADTSETMTAKIVADVAYLGLKVHLFDVNETDVVTPADLGSTGLFSFPSVPTGNNYQLVVITPSGRKILRKHLDSFSETKPSVTINTDTTAIAILVKQSNYTKSDKTLTEAVAQNDIAKLTEKITEWLKGTVASTDTDVFTAVKSTFGETELTKIIDSTTTSTLATQIIGTWQLSQSTKNGQLVPVKPNTTGKVGTISFYSNGTAASVDYTLFTSTDINFFQTTDDAPDSFSGTWRITDGVLYSTNSSGQTFSNAVEIKNGELYQTMSTGEVRVWINSSTLTGIPAEEFPTIAEAYRNMEKALEEDSTRTIEQRINAFMGHIADDFVDLAAVSAFDSLKATYISRLDRYYVIDHNFKPVSYQIVDENTLKVTTSITISMQKKPEAVGLEDDLNVIFSSVITWKNYAGIWKVQGGLPFRSSELFSLTGTSDATDYAPNSVLAPNTISTLNTPASVYAYNSTSTNVSVKLPVESGAAVNYAMVVVNTSATTQSISLRPESYVLSGSLLAQANADALRASQRLAMPPLSSLDEARMRQLPFEEKMRSDFVASLRTAGATAGLRQNRSLRVSDHSNEAVGDVVKLNIIVSYMFSQTYQERSCKLVRMTDHCKIFVDQNPYNDLSAVEGQYAITEADLDHIVSEFENYIYPLMNGQYGKVYDIDGDGRLSIVFSPVYPKIGFAGLFNTLHMNPTKTGYKDYSNQRDMLGIWTPHALSSSTSTGEKWRLDSRETIAHEMQHAINFSAKIFPNDTFRFPDDTNFNANEDSYLEAMWLDESLSVGSEARYRLARGQASIYEARFDSWAKSSPHTYGLTSWAGVLGHYGQKGLFNYYLYEKYGADKIKAMNQSTSTGVSNIEAVYGITVAELAKGFSLAVINESLRREGLTSVGTIADSYKFTQTVDLDLAEQVVTLGYTPTSLSVPAMGTAYYLLKQPASFGGGEEFQFRIESTQDQSIDILIMRLPNP